MKKINSYTQKYLIWVFPIVLATIFWSLFQSDLEIRQQGSIPLIALWEIMSWALIIWFVCLFLFMVMLVFRKDTQESTIKLLAGLKERDEREQIIMGLAARRSFLATTGLLIVLIFASCLTLTVARLPNNSIDNQKSSLSIGFNFSGFESPKTPSQDNQVTFEHRDIPLSKSALLLIVLVWQVVTFRISAKKELSEA